MSQASESEESNDTKTGSTSNTISKFQQRLEQFGYSKSPNLQGRHSSDMTAKPSPTSVATKFGNRVSLRKNTPKSATSATNKSDTTLVQGQKRDAGSDEATDSGRFTPKKRRSTARERSKNDPHNPENNLVDSLRPDLILVFIGLNPGLTTALTGHAYAHKSNRFWHLLHTSGVTPIKHDASETHDLPDLYSIGNTNICARPTRDGSTLTKEELQEGARILEDKIRNFKPEAVAIVGKQIWETLWKARTGTTLAKRDFKWGWQDEEAWLGRTRGKGGALEWKGARTFVATSTSGLSANLSPAEKLAIWQPLGEWFTSRRKDLAND